MCFFFQAEDGIRDVAVTGVQTCALPICKTTLLLQILPRLAQPPERVLYVSGEEAPRQIKMRCERLGIDSETLLIYPETNLEEILKTTQTVAPAALVVDSIQTTFTSLLTSAPGSISQVQEVAAQLMFYAKRSGTPVFLIGHVTKDGAIAGPRTLEHIVEDRKSTRLNSSHGYISYAVFCLKKKKKNEQ